MADDEIVTTIIIEGFGAIEGNFNSLGTAAEHAFGQMSKAAQSTSGYLDQLSKKITETSNAANAAGQTSSGGGLFDSLIAKVKEAAVQFEAFRTKFGGTLFSGVAAGGKEAEKSIQAVGGAVTQLATQGANLASAFGPGFGAVARGATEAASAIIKSASSLTTFSGALTAITAVGVSFVGIGAGLIAIAKHSADAVREMSDLAETMGSTIEQASALTQALREQGASTDQFGTAMARLSQTIARAWEEIQAKTQAFVSTYQGALIRARDATIALQQAQNNAALIDRQQASQRAQNALSVQGAVLSLVEAEANLARIRRGGAADPFTEGRLEAERAILQVQQARQALIDAELTRETNLLQATVARQQIQQAIVKAAKEEHDAREAVAKVMAESVQSSIQLARDLAAGGAGEITKTFEGVAVQVPKTVDNIMRGIIGAIGPAVKQVQTLDGSLIDLASAPPKVQEAFFFILDVLKGIDDEALRTSIAIRAFGRTLGPELARQAAEGSGPIKARMQELEDLGIVLDKDEKIISQQFTKAWQRLIGLVGSLGIKAGVNFQEPFIAAFNQISDALTKNRQAFFDWAKDIANLVKVVVAGLVQAFTGIDLSKALNLNPEQVLKAQEWRRTFEEIGTAAKFFGEIIAVVFRAIVAVVAVAKRAFDTFAQGLNNIFNTDFFTASGVAISAWAALIVAKLALAGAAFAGFSAAAIASLGLLLITLAVVTAAVATFAAALPDAITQVSLIAKMWQAASASGQSMGAALLILNEIFQEHKNLSKEAKQAMSNLIDEFIRSGGVINGVKLTMQDLAGMLRKLAEEADKTKITPKVDPAVTDAQQKAAEDAKRAAEAAAKSQADLDAALQRYRDSMAGTATGVSQNYRDMATAADRSARSQINSATGIGEAMDRLKRKQLDQSISSANLSVAEARYNLQVLTGQRERDEELEHSFAVRRAQNTLQDAINNRDSLVLQKQAEQQRQAGRDSAAAGDAATRAADANFAASKKIEVGSDGIKESYLNKNKVLKDQQALESKPADSGPTNQKIQDATKLTDAQRKATESEQQTIKQSNDALKDAADKRRAALEAEVKDLERKNKAIKDAADAARQAAQDTQTVDNRSVETQRKMAALIAATESQSAKDATTQMGRDAAIQAGRKKGEEDSKKAHEEAVEAARKLAETEAAGVKAAEDEAGAQQKILDIIQDTIQKLKEKQDQEQVPTPQPRPPGALPGDQPIPIDPQQFQAGVEQEKQALADLVSTAEQAAGNINDAFSNIDIGTDIEQGSQDPGAAFDSLVSQAEQAAQSVSDALSNVEFNPDQIAGDFSGLVDSATQAATDMSNAFQTVDMATGINNQIDSIETNLSQLDTAVADTGTAFDEFGSSGLSGDLATAAFGGLFRGRPGTDTNLAWITDFEYIMRPEAVRKYGVNFMHMINSMQFPGFRAGGLNLKTPAYVAGGAARAQNTRTMHITIGDQTFRNLVAPENTAKQLERAAINRQSTSTGVKPRWSR
jgi:hypothetical protein